MCRIREIRDGQIVEKEEEKKKEGRKREERYIPEQN